MNYVRAILRLIDKILHLTFKFVMRVCVCVFTIHQFVTDVLRTVTLNGTFQQYPKIHRAQVMSSVQLNNAADLN